MPAGCLVQDPSLSLSFSGTPGRGSSPSSPMYSSSDTVTCHLTHTVPCAHQKPITALKAAAGRLVTGSQDHTLRVSTAWVKGWGKEWLAESWEQGIYQFNIHSYSGVPPGGFVLPLHPAGSLWGYHNRVH